MGITKEPDGRYMLQGKRLNPSAAIAGQMSARMKRIIRAMQREVMEEIVRLFHVEHAQDSVEVRTAREIGVLPPPMVPAMDASLADLAASLITRMTDKWQPLFDREAQEIAASMVDRTLAFSDRTLGPSLAEVGKSLTMTVDKPLSAMMDAAAQESVALIKRVPGQYLPNVQQDVMRSITTGNGLQDLVPQLKARNVKVRNWAENVARDQTRKAYATINRERMEAAGIRKFKWLHSGGSNDPREYHLHAWPAGLNGGIFSFDDPPIIDKRTGERGFPGQAPYCGCTMLPVIDIDEDDDK